MTTSDETGNFCHDYIQHPLMWCDEKKRLIERKNAEESLRMWRRRKAEEMARKEKDKQEYYDLFLKHCPWGRPGGGAPNVDVRRKDITAVGLHSTPSVTTAHRVTSLQPCRYNDYFSMQKKCHNPLAAYGHLHHTHPQHPPPPPPPHHHHHAHQHLKHTHSVHHLQESGPKGSTLTICERELPVKLGAGGGAGGGGGGKNGESLEITLKEHPSMSFRNKGHLDIEVRYKPTLPGKGKPLLEKIVVTESDKCPLNEITPLPNSVSHTEQKRKLQCKLEKPLSKGPWGKAGPGGKPWRSPKAVGNTFMKSLGWTNKEMLKELDQDNPVTPAEKPTFRKVRSNKKLQRCCELCTCTCPAMATKKPPCMPPAPPPAHMNVVSPPKQKICARMPRHCGVGGRGVAGGGGGLTTTSTTLAGPTPTTDQSACISGGGGGVELVPLLARRRAINRPISLSSTDITKRTPSHDRISTAADLHYLHDLNVQISQKRRSISVNRQVERNLCNQHFATFDTFWGRPGHGAPGQITNKLKLDNLLYGNQGQPE